MSPAIGGLLASDSLHAASALRLRAGDPLRAFRDRLPAVGVV